MSYQLKVDAPLTVHEELVKPEKLPKMLWPAFCATFHPPAPPPETRTMSSTFGDGGSVTVVNCELVSRYPASDIAWVEVPETTIQPTRPLPKKLPIKLFPKLVKVLTPVNMFVPAKVLAPLNILEPVKV